MDAARSYWPIGYDDLESYYDKFEGVSGAWGKAGKLQDKKIVGGNLFEAPRSSEFPNPPLTPSHNMVSFEKAARDLGHQSFSVPAASASRPYVNPDGVALGDVTAALERRLEKSRRRNVSPIWNFQGSQARPISRMRSPG